MKCDVSIVCFLFRLISTMAQLIVKVIEGKNLKKKDLFSENDAYVKLYLDDKKQKQKTSVQHDSKTPVWNETFIL